MVKNNMKYLTIQQTNDLIKKRPAGVDPQEILDGLTSRGYTIQGLNENQVQQEGTGGLQGVGVGIAKGALSTIKGLGQVGEKIGQVLLPKSMESPSVYSEEALQKSAKEGNFIGKLLNEENLKAKTTAEKIGKTGEQILEFAIPATKVSKATKVLPLAKKIIPRAITSGAVATAQEGEVGKGTAIAVGTEIALPVVGKLANNLILKPLSRIVKGLGAGTSGGSVQDIDNILKDPTTAKKIRDAFKQKGNIEIFKNEVDTIMKGVTKIRKEASSAYSKGLDKLSSIDIKPNIIKDELKSVIENSGGKLSAKGFSLSNVEFAGDKNLIKKANDLINKINTEKDLSGRGIRQIMEYIDSKVKLKTATTDTSISFNKFVDDISNGLKNSISKSTNKLDKINAKYSQDKQLSDAIQDIFGDVKFKNLEEINKMAKKISGLSSEGGISPEIVDSFFARIKQSGQEFKTGESVRKILSKSGGANKLGLNISEITQAVTGGIVTPEVITNIAILTGKSQPFIKNLLEKTAPPLRAGVIKGLIPSKK